MKAGHLLLILGIVIAAATAIGCVAYGIANMPSDPVERAHLKQTVRAIGSLPMLAGIGLIVYGSLRIKKDKAGGGR